MARTNNLPDFLSDIANAIRTKSGNVGEIQANQFDNAILNLPAQGNYQTKTVNINDNGVYVVHPDENYDGINELTITTNVTKIIVSDGMKFGYSTFTTVSNLDTSNVTNMYNMFENCNNLISVSNFDTSNVIDMGYMFWGCYNLVSVPNFDTSNVTNMGRMFAFCNNLTTVPNFNTVKVTDMTTMFGGCDNLISIPNFDTSNVEYMEYTFRNCLNLTSVPDFNTSNVISMRDLFSNCNNLSNESIQNIVNMCINSNITDASYKNLSNENTYSPLYQTKFDNSYYSNRLSDLTNAGWNY